MSPDFDLKAIDKNKRWPKDYQKIYIRVEFYVYNMVQEIVPGYLSDGIFYDSKDRIIDKECIICWYEMP